MHGHGGRKPAIDLHLRESRLRPRLLVLDLQAHGLRVFGRVDDALLAWPEITLGNLPRVQEGLRSSGMKQAWLASNQEKLILNMHRELDRYLTS